MGPTSARFPPTTDSLKAPVSTSTPCEPKVAGSQCRASSSSAPSRSSGSSSTGNCSGKEEHGRHQMMSSTCRATGVMEYLKAEVNGAHTSIFLLVSFFTSGLIDSVAFNAWSCFVGMQTGNTIFAALGFSGQPLSAHPNAYLKSITSIFAFCLGTLFFSAFHRLPCWSDPNPAPSRHRFILIGSFTIQSVLIVIAAVLVRLGLVSNRPSVAGAFSSGNHRDDEPDPEEDNYRDLLVIALLAFQSSGPVFFSRVLGVVELPTIVLSTLYCDFIADLYRLPSSVRNRTSWRTFFFDDERRQFRRLASILILFLGGLVGGFMFRSRFGMVGAIWLAAALKGLLVLGWVFWKPEKALGHAEV